MVKGKGGVAKTRRIFSLSGLSPDVDFRVHNSNIINLERAIKERVFTVSDGEGGFRPPPKPDVATFFGRLADFKSALYKHLPSTIPVSHEEFVGMYKDRRKVIYQEAADSLVTAPIVRRDSYISAFVKAEKINFTEKADPAPRVIQPRCPRYNVEVGCYLKPIEHVIYKAIGKTFGHSTVMKGYNAKDLGAVVEAKWKAFRNPRGIGLDASRFDQHCSATALMWEHTVYKWMCGSRGRDQFLGKLLNWQIRNKGFGRCEDGYLKYEVEGCRMSGDMNTAMGNCLLMCALVWSYAKEVDVKIQLINNGDDCVVFCEAECVPRFVERLDLWFLEMGFNMKVEDPVCELEKIVFCQTQPVWTPDGYIMVRQPHTAIAKDCFSITPLDSHGGMHKYLTVLGKGGLSLTGGIPIWQDLYQLFIGFPEPENNTKNIRNVRRDRQNRVVLETGMMFLASGMDRNYTPPHPQTRCSFWRAFNITPDEQESLERYYQRSEIRWTKEMCDTDPHIPFWPSSSF